MTRRSKLTPMVIRPGARYACAGDGLCCTNIHAVGPLSRSERQMLRAVDPRLVVWRSESRDHVLIHGPDGACPFVRDDGCMIHNQLGPEAKPLPCSRFPLRLTATPRGGRISVSHVCPCASVGERPPLTVEAAEPDLRNARGALDAELRLKGPVPFAGRRTLDFDEYVQWETPLLARLARTRSPLTALGVEPFARPRRGSYLRVARVLYEGPEDNRFEVACRWLGRALLAELGEPAGRWPARPWAEAFARTAARCPEGEPAARVFGDWLSNDIWGLLWTPRTSAQGLLRELSTLTKLGSRIARALRARGVAAAPAAAEAVTILELGRDAPAWKELARSLPR